MENASSPMLAHHSQGGSGARAVPLLLTALLLSSLLACGPVEGTSEPALRGTRPQELISDNGLSLNGISFNGLSINGISFNGLSLNGISFNGLTSSEFVSWFEQDPGPNAILMRYIVRCAVPAGERRGYTESQTGFTYTWEGALGLAPDWSSGSPATEREQQLISACLAAHANRYGAHIRISVVGRNARDEPIFTSEELQQFPHREACFFGNLFTDEGLYVANDRDSQNERLSTSRGCALACNNPVTRQGCGPLVNLPGCQSHCAMDSSQTYYTSCTYNGLTYVPVTTRMLPENVYRCGDGICQHTESCGDGSRYDSCKDDCGPCESGDTGSSEAD